MRKALFISCSLFMLLACNSGDNARVKQTASPAPSADTIPRPAPPDTVTALNDRQDSLLLFRSPGGKLYKTALVKGDEDSLDFSIAALSCDNDNFSGTDRKLAKISIATAPVEDISFSTFLTGLVKDDIMIGKNISKGPGSNRVKEEKRNVRLKNVFLYAIKREPDNDYHIIIGNASGTRFLNIENSGLPKSNAAAFQKLKTVRKNIEDFFGELCSSKYRTFEPGIPVEIEGSLFYDVDHKPGVVGPAGFKPKTSWEVHPVTKITFTE